MTEEFLAKHIMLAIVRATRKAKDAFAKKIQAGFEEDRIEIVAKPLQKRGQNQIIENEEQNRPKKHNSIKKKSTKLNKFVDADG